MSQVLLASHEWDHGLHRRKYLRSVPLVVRALAAVVQRHLLRRQPLLVALDSSYSEVLDGELIKTTTTVSSAIPVFIVLNFMVRKMNAKLEDPNLWLFNVGNG